LIALAIDIASEPEIGKLMTTEYQIEKDLIG